MAGLTWPAFAKLQGVQGVGQNVIRSAIWSELSSDWIAQNNPLPVRVAGRSPSPATTLPATDVWPNNTVRTPPTAGVSIACASDSATDSFSAVTGAMAITVPYVDTSWNWHYLVFQLNGTTKVSTPYSVDGVVGAAAPSNVWDILPWTFVSQSGTSGAPNSALQVGNIYVGNAADAFTSGIPTSANMYDKLLIGDNRSHLGCLTIPSGMAFVLLHAFVFSSYSGTTAQYGKAWISIASWPGALSGNPQVWTPGAGPIMPWQNMIFSAPAVSAGIPEWTPNWPDILMPQSKLKFSALAGAASGEISVVVEGCLAPWPWTGNP